MNDDSLTIVRSRGRRLAKLIDRASIDGYDAARTVDLFAEPVAGLADIEEVLRQLQPRWDCAVLRGGVADPGHVHGVRRLLYADNTTGEPPSLVDVPRRWLALDIDALPVAAGIDITDLVACGHAACAALPVLFHDTTMLVQATASHGIKPGLHLRLWFWLSRATAAAELKIWLRGAPVDASIFCAAQIIYVAAPLFAAGAVDPLPERLAVRFGAGDEVAVPATALLRPPASASRQRPLPPPGHVLAAGYAAATLAQIAAAVLGTPVGRRHRTIVVGGHRLAELERHGLLHPHDSERLLFRAAKGSGLADDRGEAILEKEIHAILTWARRVCAEPGGGDERPD